MLCLPVTAFRGIIATGISSHADDTTIIGNTISHAAGAGVRIGTSEPDDDGRYYGIDNTVSFIKDGHKNPFETANIYGATFPQLVCPRQRGCGSEGDTVRITAAVERLHSLFHTRSHHDG